MNKYYITFTIIFLFFTGCQKKTVSYNKIFEATLGSEHNQIGTNIPILDSYSNRQGFPDSFLTDLPELTIQNKKVFIADSYNKRISIFPIVKKGKNIENTSEKSLTIPNKGTNYEFARPYKTIVDTDDNIYILASIQDFESYEVQNFSNQTQAVQDYNQFQNNLKKIPAENFYLYKFSAKGDFLYRLGLNGVNSQPFVYPYSLNSDNRGNIYLGFYQLSPKNPNREELLIRRYSSQGQTNAYFDSSKLDLSTNINGIQYQGHIVSANNYREKDELALVVEYQPTVNENNESIPAIIDNIWSLIKNYSFTKNIVVEDIVQNSLFTEAILGIDKYDRIFFQSFDEELNALKIRVLSKNQKNKIYHTPLQSSYYTLFDYFIDIHGNLYNYLLDRNNKLIVLQWDIEPQEEKETQQTNSTQEETTTQ